MKEAGRWDELVQLCLANYEFLLAKLSVSSFEELLQDFDVQLPGEEHTLLFEKLLLALQDAQSVLEEDPHQITGQLAARLLPPLGMDSALDGIPAVLLEAARLRGTVRDLAFMPRFAVIPFQGNTIEVSMAPERFLRLCLHSGTSGSSRPS